MHGRSRIAVAELCFFKKHDQGPADQGLQESIKVKRYCLFLFTANHYAYMAGVAT